MNGTIYFCSQEYRHFVLQTVPSGNEKVRGENDNEIEENNPFFNSKWQVKEV